MSSPRRAQHDPDRHEADEGAHRRPTVFVSRLVLVLLLVAAFLLLFRRSTRLEPKLQAVLDAEEAALKAGNWQEFSALLDPDHAPYRQYQKSQFDAVMAARRGGGSYTGIPYPLHIVEAGRRDNRAWARVSAETPAGDTILRVEFFRQVYGDWLHTGPDPGWWGPERKLRTEHVMWHYREAEEEWVAAAAPIVEAAHARACADFGLDSRKNVVTFRLCYDIACTGVPFYPTSPTIELPAPLLAGWHTEAIGEWLPGFLVGHLLSRAADQRFDPEVSIGSYSPLMEGIRLWETEQVTGVPVDETWLADLRAATATGHYLSLDELSSPSASSTGLLRYAQSYALVDYVVATRGSSVLPALARASSPSNSLRRALKQVLGEQVDLTAFEEEWMAWMQERYAE